MSGGPYSATGFVHPHVSGLGFSLALCEQRSKVLKKNGPTLNRARRDDSYFLLEQSLPIEPKNAIARKWCHRHKKGPKEAPHPNYAHLRPVPNACESNRKQSKFERYGLVSSTIQHWLDHSLFAEDNRTLDGLHLPLRSQM